MTAEVTPAAPGQDGELGALLTRAFDADPLFRWVLPDDGRRSRRLAPWAAASVRVARAHGVVDTAGEGGAVAVWYPPGRSPGALDQLFGGTTRPLIGLGPGAVLRLAAADRQAHAARRRHDRGSAWYLAFLATHPDHQGRGLAGALLRRGLARADRTGVPVWLETNAARNVEMYSRFGFEAVAHEPAGRLPAFWGLLRPARGATEPGR